MAEPAQHVDLDQVGRDLFEQWKYARAAVEYWTGKKDELAALLTGRMGEATRATIDGRHVATWVPPTTVNRFDEKRFHELEPDTWAAFVVPTRRAGYLRLATGEKDR
jgi:hypothetical protein